MTADWRVTVQLDGKSRASRAVLHGEVADGLRARLDGRAGISADGYRLFVYTETEALAGQAAQAALQLAGESGLAPQVTLDWWNADAAEWGSGDDGPRPDQERAVGQHERQVAADARRSAATGVPQWTVRVTLPSRDDAVRLAGRDDAVTRAHAESGFSQHTWPHARLAFQAPVEGHLAGPSEK